MLFQSPRSGQICSNAISTLEEIVDSLPFQSPRSGQICLNYIKLIHKTEIGEVSIP